MPLPTTRTVVGRRRAAYDRVAAQEHHDESESSPESAGGGGVSPSSTNPPNVGDDETALLTTETSDTPTTEGTSSSLLLQDSSPSSADNDDEESLLKLVILDPAHHRFTVHIKHSATVSDLKQVGSKVHKVPARSQRLIYRGKLLDDDDTLEEMGITQNDTLLHLFPKPRVVVKQQSDTTPSSSCAAAAANDDDDSSSTGAHVPQIILDPDEAEQRASILVLGSDEVMEAQNNVKLLSFFLLIICGMELLALFTIAMGVPQDNASPYNNNDNDDPANSNSTHGGGGNHTDGGGGLFPPQPASHEEYRTWETQDYFDLAISSIGFYVAILGIKATTENTLRLAKQYMVGVFITGIAWNVFYYVMNVKAEQKADQERVERNDDDFPPEENKDFYIQAAFAMILPAVVWFLCCIRARQFYTLLREAEEEAEERIRNEISDLEQGGAVIVGGDGRQTLAGTDNHARRRVDGGGDGDDGDQELTLQNESATII